MQIKNKKVINEIYKQLKKDFKLSDKEIMIWLKKEQEQYWGLSPIEFISIDVIKNSLIVLNNIKKMKYQEAMGA